MWRLFSKRSQTRALNLLQTSRTCWLRGPIAVQKMRSNAKHWNWIEKYLHELAHMPDSSLSIALTRLPSTGTPSSKINVRASSTRCRRRRLSQYQMHVWGRCPSLPHARISSYFFVSFITCTQTVSSSWSHSTHGQPRSHLKYWTSLVCLEPTFFYLLFINYFHYKVGSTVTFSWRISQRI